MTRAVTIVAPRQAIWPWFVQLGYVRAGWYSYDWIDNDGQSSSDRLVPEFQNLEVRRRVGKVEVRNLDVLDLTDPDVRVALGVRAI